MCIDKLVSRALRACRSDDEEDEKVGEASGSGSDGSGRNLNRSDELCSMLDLHLVRVCEVCGVRLSRLAPSPSSTSSRSPRAPTLACGASATRDGLAAYHCSRPGCFPRGERASLVVHHRSLQPSVAILGRLVPAASALSPRRWLRRCSGKHSPRALGLVFVALHQIHS